MRIDNWSVFNFEGAIRGMRNAMNSWHKADSEVNPDACKDHKCDKCPYPCDGFANPFVIGPNDMDLAVRLVKAGPSHRKFLRQIGVCCDITAPLFWYKEFDQYKINTTTNSTSTMHKLASTPITIDCFETDDLSLEVIDELGLFVADDTINFMGKLIDDLEYLRQRYNETKDIRYWKELIRWLPESWLQTRTWTANYEVLRGIYEQRRAHKLTEWHTFCEWIEQLPYAKEFICN